MVRTGEHIPLPHGVESIATKIVDPETMEERPLGETGMLLV